MAEVVRDTRLHFIRCKEQNKELYHFMKDHDEEFIMEDSNFRQLFHQNNTNIIKGFNNF
jgi:hypothetical protein